MSDKVIQGLAAAATVLVVSRRIIDALGQKPHRTDTEEAQLRVMVAASIRAEQIFQELLTALEKGRDR